jgi:glycosyltransferase involved in cell wall biosynthesis
MKFSIVTISFNQAAFLRECMDSVLAQDGVDLEYIVVDPGSRDGSRAIIETYGDRVLRVFAPDDGPADGLNKGFALATGDYLGFLNSDDVLLPHALSRVAQRFAQVPTVDVVSGSGYFVDEHGSRLAPIIPSRLTPWLYAHGAVSVFQQGTFFRTSCFRQVGGFNRDNKTCWDGELLLDMALSGARFATIGDVLAHFRLHGGGITGSGRLTDLYRLDCQRLFTKATGRQRQAHDRAFDLAARLAKFCLDPRYLLRRLARRRSV